MFPSASMGSADISRVTFQVPALLRDRTQLLFSELRVGEEEKDRYKQHQCCLAHSRCGPCPFPPFWHTVSQLQYPACCRHGACAVSKLVAPPSCNAWSSGGGLGWAWHRWLAVPSSWGRATLLPCKEGTGLARASMLCKLQEVLRFEKIT